MVNFTIENTPVNVTEFPAPHLLNNGKRILIITPYLHCRGYIERSSYKASGQPSLRILDERRRTLIHVTIQIANYTLEPDCCFINEYETIGIEEALIKSSVIEMTRESAILGRIEYPVARIIMK